MILWVRSGAPHSKHKWPPIHTCVCGNVASHETKRKQMNVPPWHHGRHPQSGCTIRCLPPRGMSCPREWRMWEPPKCYDRVWNVTIHWWVNLYYFPKIPWPNERRRRGPESWQIRLRCNSASAVCACACVWESVVVVVGDTRGNEKKTRWLMRFETTMFLDSECAQ